MSHRLLDGAFAALFLAVLAAPSLDMLLRDSSTRSMQAEMRVANQRPPLPRDLAQLERFPAAFSDYYQDSFGLRDVLIKLHNRLKWFVLDESPTERLVLGEQDWVFYTQTDAIRTYRAPPPLHESELETWAAMLEARRDWLAQRGIEFLFVLVPSKAAVYADRLPEHLHNVGPSRRQQFLEYMARHSDVHVLDLLPALQAERAFDDGNDLTYNKYGTHWTDRGAQAGTWAILRSLQERWPALEPWPRSEFERRPGEDLIQDSWTSRLYLAGLLDEAFYGFVSLRPEPARSLPVQGKPMQQTHFVQPDSGLPRVMVLHDSFGWQITPQLARHCSELWGYWQVRFDTALIEQNPTDLLIQVFLDRCLDLQPAALTEEVGGARLRARFERSQHVLLALGPRDLLGTLQPFGTPDLRLLDDPAPALELVTHAANDLVYLPAVDLPPEGGAILRLDVTIPATTEMTLFFTTGAQQDHDRERAYTTAVPAGRSTVHFQLAAPDTRGRLLLLPGKLPGRYLLHGIELRAPPAD